jgi:hypothetical protein
MNKDKTRSEYIASNSNVCYDVLGSRFATIHQETLHGNVWGFSVVA